MYPELQDVGANASLNWQDRLSEHVIPYLVNKWLEHYHLAVSGGDIVEVRPGKFFYLFDMGAERLIAAWGISDGRFSGERDKPRMAAFPVSARPLYHAGHAIPHRLGGGTDINLTPQLGNINTGPFRTLENRAMKAPGSLYFTYWIYGHGSKVQLARRVQQGLLICGAKPDIRIFEN